MNTTCEFCGANLSRQEGFDPSLDLWACRRCGYENGTESTGSSANDLNFDDFDFDDFLNPKPKKAAPVKTTTVAAAAPKAPVRPTRVEEPKDDYYDDEESYDSYNRYSSDFDDEDDYYDEGRSAGTVVKNIFLILVMLYSVFTIVHQLCPGLFSF